MFDRSRPRPRRCSSVCTRQSVSSDCTQRAAVAESCKTFRALPECTSHHGPGLPSQGLRMESCACLFACCDVQYSLAHPSLSLPPERFRSAPLLSSPMSRHDLFTPFTSPRLTVKHRNSIFFCSHHRTDRTVLDLYSRLCQNASGLSSLNTFSPSRLRIRPLRPKPATRTLLPSQRSRRLKHVHWTTNARTGSHRLRLESLH